jgi:hypothetical protein
VEYEDVGLHLLELLGGEVEVAATRRGRSGRRGGERVRCLRRAGGCAGRG